MLTVGHGPAENRGDVGSGKGLEGEQATAADEGAGERERRILGRGADQGDRPLLDIGEENILLGLVEAVNLIDEQARPLAVVLEPATGCVEHLANLLHPRSRGGELDEAAPRLAGDDLGEGRLPHPRRTMEDHRSDPVRFDEPAEESTGADDMLLPHVVGEPARPHPGCQRRGPGNVGGSRSGKQIGHGSPGAAGISAMEKGGADHPVQTNSIGAAISGWMLLCTGQVCAACSRSWRWG